MGSLRVGRMPYANLFPLFYTLEHSCDCSSYRFVDGVPSVLNALLRRGEVDISPSSSIEYLRNPSLYTVIEGHSISSRGPVESIFLFSSKPVESLDGMTIDVTYQSETSVGLLEIVLRMFYGVTCQLRISERPEQQREAPFLLIGDDAMRCRKAQRTGEIEACYCSPYVYDLGEVWYRHTGLPFVFALWIGRKDLFKSSRREPGSSGSAEEERAGLARRFVADLDKAKDMALRNRGDIAKCSPQKSFYTEQEIIAYWDNLDYDLSDDHKRGLALYETYLRELSLL